MRCSILFVFHTLLTQLLQAYRIVISAGQTIALDSDQQPGRAAPLEFDYAGPLPSRKELDAWKSHTQPVTTLEVFHFLQRRLEPFKINPQFVMGDSGDLRVIQLKAGSKGNTLAYIALKILDHNSDVWDNCKRTDVKQAILDAKIAAARKPECPQKVMPYIAYVKTYQKEFAAQARKRGGNLELAAACKGLGAYMVIYALAAYKETFDASPSGNKPWGAFKLAGDAQAGDGETVTHYLKTLVAEGDIQMPSHCVLQNESGIKEDIYGYGYYHYLGFDKSPHVGDDTHIGIIRYVLTLARGRMQDDDNKAMAAQRAKDSTPVRSTTAAVQSQPQPPPVGTPPPGEDALAKFVRDHDSVPKAWSEHADSSPVSTRPASATKRPASATTRPASASSNVGQGRPLNQEAIRASTNLFLQQGPYTGGSQPLQLSSRQATAATDAKPSGLVAASSQPLQWSTSTTPPANNSSQTNAKPPGLVLASSQPMQRSSGSQTNAQPSGLAKPSGHRSSSTPQKSSSTPLANRNVGHQQRLQLERDAQARKRREADKQARSNSVAGLRRAPPSLVT